MGINRLNHAVYDRRYGLVWALKYRKWLLRDEVREAIGELTEMEIAGDHVHHFTSIPLKYSVGEIVRVLKSVSAKEISHSIQK